MKLGVVTINCREAALPTELRTKLLGVTNILAFDVHYETRSGPTRIKGRATVQGANEEWVRVLAVVQYAD